MAAGLMAAEMMLVSAAMSRAHISDMDFLTSRFAVELHIQTPSLGEIVHKAVNDAYASGLEGRSLRSRIADAIEDGLAHAGEGLHHHLNDAAMADWRDICSRAFDSALKATFNGGEATGKG